MNKIVTELLVLNFSIIISLIFPNDYFKNQENDECPADEYCFNWATAIEISCPGGDGECWTNPELQATATNENEILFIYKSESGCGLSIFGSESYCYISNANALAQVLSVSPIIPVIVKVPPPPCTNPPCQAPTPQPTPMPPTGKCPGPEVIPGKISAFASKDAPPYALVVGQDPAKRGVDLTYSFSIQPTLYHTWAWGIVDESTRCEYDPAGGYSGCPLGKYANGWRSWWESSPYTYVNHQVVWGCVEHTTVYREGVRVIIPSANLSTGSISWITNDLAQRYPGAFLHHPKWSWGYAGPGFGSFSGSTFIWNFSIKKVQVSDPGIYDLIVSGLTTGTPVSQPRSFSIRAGSMDVYLLETTIIH